MLAVLAQPHLLVSAGETLSNAVSRDGLRARFANRAIHGGACASIA
jgi:hypothetical protein